MKKINCVGVYCSTSDRIDPFYFQVAAEMGALLAKHNLKMVYGGGNWGLMGATAKAVLENGGEVLGFTTSLLAKSEGVYPHLNHLEVVGSIHTRKKKMEKNSDAFIILPGGFGTLDEFFEVLTLRQIQVHNKSIIVVNAQGYWSLLKTLFDHVIDQNFALPHQRDFVTFVETPQQALHELIGG